MRTDARPSASAGRPHFPDRWPALFGFGLSTAGPAACCLRLRANWLAAALGASRTLVIYLVVLHADEAAHVRCRHSSALCRGAPSGAHRLGPASHGSIARSAARRSSPSCFLWQIPAFSWRLRGMYPRPITARAGFPMLPVIEPEGRRAGRQAVMYAAGPSSP